MNSDEDRIERALIVLLLQNMKGQTLREKVLQLNLIGLANSEIAEFLGTTSAAVSQYLYEARRGRKKTQRVAR